MFLCRFVYSITPAACQSLEHTGYAVIDNVFGLDWSLKLKDELIRLKQQGKMRLNSTHLIKQGDTELLEKQHVYEAELHDVVIHMLSVLHKPSLIRHLSHEELQHSQYKSTICNECRPFDRWHSCRAAESLCFPVSSMQLTLLTNMQAVQEAAPLCQLLNQDTTMRTMLSLFIPHLRLDSQAIKLQCNAGMFAMHTWVCLHGLVLCYLSDS